MEEVRNQVMLSLLEKDYVVFAPKSNKDLKREYPELSDYREFTEITSTELLFVWYWASPSSPLAELAEEKRLDPAIDRAFLNASQKEARKIEYAGMNFPSGIKAAIKRMEKFNPGMRVQIMVTKQHLFNECQTAILRKPNYGDPEEVETYLKTSAVASKLMSEIQKETEKGNLGVEESKETALKNLEGASAAFHKQRN